MKVGTHSRLRSESVEDIHSRPYSQANFALNEVPDLFLMLDNLLVMPRLQFVEIINLLLQHRKRFTEALKVCDKI